LAPCTIAVMVVGLELSEANCGELASSVMLCCVATTLTVDLPDTEPDVAVIVIVDPAETPAADRLAVMVPFAAVLAAAPDSVPLVADSVTGTPLSALLFASFASTVIVAELLPSAGIEAALLDTVKVATFEVGGGVVPPPPLVLVPQLPAVLPLLVLPLVTLPQPLSPPQPARARVTTNTAIIDASVRMFLLPESCLGVTRSVRISTR
jgi:hypothetical protein